MTFLLTFGFVTHASTAGGYAAVTKGSSLFTHFLAYYGVRTSHTLLPNIDCCSAPVATQWAHLMMMISTKSISGDVTANR